MSIKQAIVSLHSDIKNEPDFVCTCCHHLMYRKSVILCNPVKYSKCGDELLNCVFSADLRYVCDTGDEYVCKTCDRALKRGVMPLQAKANGLKLSEIPPELADLNALELRLICLRLPFMKMVALPSGKQRSIHGPAVNVPTKVDTVCNILPSQTELVPLKLKRKLAYKGHYLYDYITPQKLLDALSFLKANNPLYADIDVNQEWLKAAVATDAELCECLVQTLIILCSLLFIPRTLLLMLNLPLTLPLFSTVSDCYAQLYDSGSLWCNHFIMHKLTQVMRQRGDLAFAIMPSSIKQLYS